MNELEIIATAVAAAQAGAMVGITKAGEQAIADAYAGLRARLRRYQSVDTSIVVQQPDSVEARSALAAALDEAGAASDADLLAAATLVIEETREHVPSASKFIGANLEDVVAAALHIKQRHLPPNADGIHVKGAKIDGPIDLDQEWAGDNHPSP